MLDSVLSPVKADSASALLPVASDQGALGGMGRDRVREKTRTMLNSLPLLLPLSPLLS